MRELELAYLAGVIDSDGYITVHRSMRNGKAYCAARIGIAGTRRQPHDLAASLWGGKISIYAPKNPRHRSQFQWCRTGDVAASAIKQVQPYLRVKREQARIALQVQEIVIGCRGEEPSFLASADQGPSELLARLREEVVQVLNQDRRAPTLHQLENDQADA